MSILKIRNSETGGWEPIRCVQVEGGGAAVPEYVTREVQRLAAVVQSHQSPYTISFLACSDLHYYSPDNGDPKDNAGKMQEAVVTMGQAMGLLRQRVKIDFAAMLGDMTWDHEETREELLEEMRFVNACLHNGFGELPQLRMEGNHDDGYESDCDLDQGEVFANIGAWNDGAVFGSRTDGYCYRDFDSVKLRVICLNSSQCSGGAQFSAQQVAWLATALDLSGKGADWRSIILSHHPLDWGRSGGEDPTAVLSAAVGLIASFHGHIHNFLTGTVGNTGLLRIGIPNAGYSRENQYGIDWKEPVTYTKVPGSAENTSFCVVTIDTAEKKIYADHYGAGYDRILTFDGVSLNTFGVQMVLSNVSASNTAQSVYEGSSYSNQLTADAGYAIKTVRVTMGGVDITASAVSGGKVTIGSVTGEIVITATAEQTVQVDGNLVGTTVAVDSNAVFNGTGFMDGYYASGVSVSADEDCVVTGLLPYDYAGGVRTPILIQGCTLDTGNSHIRILGFNSEKKCYFQSAAGGELTTYFQVDVLGTNSYRVTPLDAIGGTGAEVKYLRFSLLGKGENLVIILEE